MHEAAEHGGAVFYHCDITPRNIVYKDGKSRLIDFGLTATRPSEVFSEIVTNNLHYVWPPEIYLIRHLHKRRLNARADERTSNLQLTWAFTSEFWTRCEAHKAVARDPGVLKVLFANWYANTKAAMETEPRTVQSFEAEYAKKFDTYSMGVTVMRILSIAWKDDLTDAMWAQIAAWAQKAAHPSPVLRPTAPESRDTWLRIWGEIAPVASGGAGTAGGRQVRRRKVLKTGKQPAHSKTPAKSRRRSKLTSKSRSRKTRRLKSRSRSKSRKTQRR